MLRQRKIRLFVLTVILCLCVLVSLSQFAINSFKIQMTVQKLSDDYPSGRLDFEANILEDMVPRTAGTPLRSVIVSTWRSGSSFLANMVNSVPGNYYHCEPLGPYGVIQIREPPNDTQAIADIKNLLNCDYTNMDDFFDFGRGQQFTFYCNWRVWKTCQYHLNTCYQPRFLSHICDQFPLQSMKLVRLRLKIAQQLLEDASLNVKMLLLVRDPRGIMRSRKQEDWCQGQPDCDDPQFLCADMVSDYHEAVKLVKKYPITFKAVRYEDLSMSPYEKSKEILQFYGRPFDPQVQDFLDSYKKTDDGGTRSTAAFKWIKKLTFDEIDNIQESCEEAMELWGYRKLTEADNIETFSPLSSNPRILDSF